MEWRRSKVSLLKGNSWRRRGKKRWHSIQTCLCRSTWRWHLKCHEKWPFTGYLLVSCAGRNSQKWVLGKCMTPGRRRRAQPEGENRQPLHIWAWNPRAARGSSYSARIKRCGMLSNYSKTVKIPFPWQPGEEIDRNTFKKDKNYFMKHLCDLENKKIKMKNATVII